MDQRMDPRLSREDARLLPQTSAPQQQPPQQHGGPRSHPYVLPWEDSMPEDGPPLEYAQAAATYSGEPEDKGGEGRRSRQEGRHRRSEGHAEGMGGTGDWGGAGPERLPADRGT